MKTRRGQIISVLIVLIIAAGSLVYTFTSGNKPLLGLDLAGGLSVVLKPKQAVGDEQLQQAIAIIRQRIDAIGVAEPEISQQGDNILIQIPGVEDKERALQLVGQTAELRFRPVISSCQVGAEAPATTAPPGSAPPGSAPASVPASVPASTPADPNAPTTTAAPGAPTTSAPAAAPTTPAPAPPSSQGAAAAPGWVVGESASGPAVPQAVATDGAVMNALPEQDPTPSVPVQASTPAVPGQTPAVPGQTPAVPGQTPAVPGQTPAVPGQSPVVPGQSPAVPGQTPVAGDPTATGQAGAAAGTTPIFQPGPCPANVQEMITKPEAEKTDQPAILPGFEDENDPKKMTDVYQLGPVNAKGNILEDANASLSQQGAQWVVNPKFKAGKDGIDVFNASAQVCKPAGPTCPTGRQAITLDGRVVSAPSIQPQEQSFKPFSADAVQISGSFNEKTARELATQLKYGALPVELVQQQVQTVSETLGKDALKAGLISGFVGLALVAVYMILFYRLLGAMAVFKLAIEGAILWSFIALLGSKAGLALTLAGVTGLIVSIGVSLDSNVVYYEHLKEDLRHGRTLRSSVDKAFHGSFRTILKADGVSIIGALLLYMLSVGPVRGFAFYLILAMVLDLLTSRFYMYPAVLLVCRSKLAMRKPGLFGLPGVDMTASNRAAEAAHERSIASRPSKKGRTSDPSLPKKDKAAGRRSEADDAETDEAEADQADADSDQSSAEKAKS